MFLLCNGKQKQMPLHTLIRELQVHPSSQLQVTTINTQGTKPFTCIHYILTFMHSCVKNAMHEVARHSLALTVQVEELLSYVLAQTIMWSDHL